MKTMDRKIAQRRHGVNEERAATRLRIVVSLVAVVVVVATGFLILRSPLLSIDRVVVTGAEHSNPQLAIDRAGIAEGTPTIAVDAGALETALRSDPWIEDAIVAVSWPGTVEVEVTEHRPVALVQTGNGFAHVAASGDVVQMIDDPTGWPVIVRPSTTAIRAGAVLGSPAITGALEFVVSLPAELATVTVVTIDAEKQLTAVVGDHPVRLGRAVDMGAKAAALAAVFEVGIGPGSPIDVTAPRRPAVGQPGQPSS